MYLIPFRQVTGLEPSDEPELAETPSATDSVFPTTYTVETTTGNGTVSLEDEVILYEDRDDLFNQASPRDRIQVDAPEEVTSENMWQRTEVLAGKDGLHRHVHVYVVAV